jgi:nitrite reductase (NADH) large subunit
MHICGDEQPYEQKTLGATLHAFDAKLFSIGDLGFHDDKKYETVMSRDDLNKIYKKVFFSEGKVVGGVLFGDLSLTNSLVTAVQKAITVEDAVDNKLI